MRTAAAMQEDAFPTAPSRSYKDVIDLGNAICAAERAKKWRVARVLCTCGEPVFYLGLCRECDKGAL